PIPFDGRQARIVVVSDLTRLRETESQLQFLAEHLSDVIFRYRFEPTPGFDYISPTCVHITGYTAEEYYADADLAWKTVHPDDLPAINALLDLGNTVPEPVVIRVIRKDGSMLWTEQRMTPLDDGKAVAGMARDITDRVHLEDQL